MSVISGISPTHDPESTKLKDMDGTCSTTPPSYSPAHHHLHLTIMSSEEAKVEAPPSAMEGKSAEEVQAIKQKIVEQRE